jgi:hypothetical protein
MLRKKLAALAGGATLLGSLLAFNTGAKADEPSKPVPIRDQVVTLKDSPTVPTQTVDRRRWRDDRGWGVSVDLGYPYYGGYYYSSPRYRYYSYPRRYYVDPYAYYDPYPYPYYGTRVYYRW